MYHCKCEITFIVGFAFSASVVNTSRFEMWWIQNKTEGLHPLSTWMPWIYTAPSLEMIALLTDFLPQDHWVFWTFLLATKEAV